MFLGRYLMESLLRQARRWSIGKSRDHLPKHFARGLKLLGFVAAEADLEQRIGELAGLRVLLDDALKGGLRFRIGLVHIVGLAQPVLRVVGQRAIGIGDQKFLECRDGAVILAVFQQIECRLVGELVFA